VNHRIGGNQVHAVPAWPESPPRAGSCGAGRITLATSSTLSHTYRTLWCSPGSASNPTNTSAGVQRTARAGHHSSEPSALTNRAITGIEPTPREHHAQLTAVKDIAYAWRQAVFLLSACSLDEQRTQVSQFAERARAAATGLEPVTRGLQHVVDGERFDATGQSRGDSGRRLLGWSVEPHWLLQRGSEKDRYS
jgi:hypothetical protein